jgi:hypothetical protein
VCGAGVGSKKPAGECVWHQEVGGLRSALKLSSNAPSYGESGPNFFSGRLYGLVDGLIGVFWRRLFGELICFVGQVVQRQVSFHDRPP